jgi:hypothetical protein
LGFILACPNLFGIKGFVVVDNNNSLNQNKMQDEKKKAKFTEHYVGLFKMN